MEESRKVRVSAGVAAGYATLNDTQAADGVWNSLPLEFRVQTWGDELYGTVPLDLKLEMPQEVVLSGDLAYWPPGHAFCIFFGPTPASEGDEPRAASAVTVFGHIEGDPTVFRAVKGGTKIRVERA
ncbi:MAG: hypothetical protein JW846_02040 [Dehalococcoidia bacterium]|nr:hypothetical protein [Dehalococcoidia bacterium]